MSYNYGTPTMSDVEEIRGNVTIRSVDRIWASGLG